MLYDLAQAPPEPGSLLESVFLVLTKRRQEAEFLQTRVIVEAALAPHLEGKSKISDTFNDYLNAVFPWFRLHKGKTEKDMADALKQWVGKKALRVRPLWQNSQKPKRIQSSLARGREKVEERERMRREGRVKKLK